MSDEKIGLVKLTGLWKQQGKDGKVYYSGSLTYSTNVLLFPNKYKEANDNNPDLILYIARKEKKEEKPKSQSLSPEEDPGDETIPF